MTIRILITIERTEGEPQPAARQAAANDALLPYAQKAGRWTPAVLAVVIVVGGLLDFLASR